MSTHTIFTIQKKIIFTGSYYYFSIIIFMCVMFTIGNVLCALHDKFTLNLNLSTYCAKKNVKYNFVLFVCYMFNWFNGKKIVNVHIKNIFWSLKQVLGSIKKRIFSHTLLLMLIVYPLVYYWNYHPCCLSFWNI